MTVLDRQASFNHVMDTLEIPEDAVNYLKKMNVTNIRRLAGLKEDDFIKFENESNGVVSKGIIIELRNFKIWLANYMRDTKQAPVEWDVVFTPDVWDTFMMMEQQELSSVASRSVKRENASVSEDRPVASNVKVDLRSYPTFDGKLQNWKPFKRQFYAMAQMHSLDYLLSKSIDSLGIVEESEKYKKDNKFLQSALTYALAKSHEKNDSSGDGKQS